MDVYDSKEKQYLNKSENDGDRYLLFSFITPNFSFWKE